MMDSNDARNRQILVKVRDHELQIEEALKLLASEEHHFGGWACLDRQRQARTGIPEVVYGENKSAEQITVLLKRLMEEGQVAMATRVERGKAEVVCRMLPHVRYEVAARMLVGHGKEPGSVGRGMIVVVAAGTSDIPVAEEACVTAMSLGHRVERAYDVGVAGIHRLLARRDLLVSASVIIAVAGMEGALPSVVAGLVEAPVIAVPTSVGYGVGFGGVAALMGMLNSCAPGVAVVNIDNGFGAACMAVAINSKK